MWTSDGRTLALSGGFGDGPDARYLAALLRALPQIEVPSREPTILRSAVLSVVGGAGLFALLPWVAPHGERPPRLPLLSPLWALALVGLVLAVVAFSVG